ncbi:MAG: hypothetical protein HYZ27_02520, partial [Deltaproteobacteria bacterium]|nr:hypothetical protein [Deltaproteobacteria bacterium]
MRWAVLLVALLTQTACEEPPIVIGASLASPMGLAAANRYLFIANHDEDALQVLDLSGGLESIQFVESPSRYFPVRIPAGSGPTDLAATANGRFVVVLDVYSEALRLVDAGKRTSDSPILVRTEPGNLESPILEVAVGPPGSRPTTLVASPAACELSDCAGRVFVALAGQGAVVSFVVLANSPGPRLEVERVYAVGGEPVRLSVSPNGLLVFATDLSAPDLLRIDRITGAVERRDVGDAGGPLAVSQDGELVIVGRPTLRDVVVFAEADSGALGLIDADSAFAPVPDPACLQLCGEPDRCAREHPADRSLCMDGTGGLSATSEPYRALYLGRVPAHIATLGVAAGHSRLKVTCDTPTYDEFAVVAGIDGLVRLVGLLGTGRTFPAPVLAAEGACVPPSVKAERYEVDVTSNLATRLVTDVTGLPLNETLATLFEPCPATPALARFRCLTSGAGGMVLSPGNTGNLAWELRWEGVLVSRNPGAGEFPCRSGDTDTCGASTRTFTDLAINLGAFPIREDDILEILTPPACSPSTLCSYERRIESVDRTSDRAVITLKEPLDPGCFRGGGVMDYRIRVGDAFLAISSRSSRGSERVKPGQTFGPGGDVAKTQAELFKLKAL